MAVSQAREFAKQLCDLQSEVQQLGDLHSKVMAIQDDVQLICQSRGSQESSVVLPLE